MGQASQQSDPAPINASGAGAVKPTLPLLLACLWTQVPEDPPSAMLLTQTTLISVPTSSISYLDKNTFTPHPS